MDTGAPVAWIRARTNRSRVATFVSLNPGRDVQRVGTAAFLGEDVQKIHDPVWAVIGNLGDSQCYLGRPAEGAGRPGRPVTAASPRTTCRSG